MKVLTVRQPWAWAIMYAGKDIENRDWSTRVRGRIAIHAAQGLGLAEYEDAADSILHICGRRPPDYGELTRGAIIGTVEIVDCVAAHQSPWFFGQYGFVLRYPNLIKPIPCKGRLGFWECEL